MPVSVDLGMAAIGAGGHSPKHCGVNPRIACKRKWPRIQAIEEYKTFQKEYREALVEYLDGNRDVIFPYGTWWMRVFHGMRCHPPPLT